VRRWNKKFIAKCTRPGRFFAGRESGTVDIEDMPCEGCVGNTSAKCSGGERKDAIWHGSQEIRMISVGMTESMELLQQELATSFRSIDEGLGVIWHVCRAKDTEKELLRALQENPATVA
jgi:hypothetical protein